MIKLPVRFEEKLKGVTNYANLYKAIDRFNQLLSENNLYFFEEYTDHGYSHINSVLETADKIIDNETFELLSSNDIFLLVSAICLHDLGMHLKFVSFKNLVENDRSIICDSFDSKTWKELWINYTIEAQKFSSRKRYEIFGDSEINIIIPDLTNKDKLTGIDKKLIGEFIRRHHPRIAHEIAVSGIVGDKSNILFFDNEVEDDFKDLSGLLARSHGMDLRDTFKYLKAKFDRIWKQPYDTNYIFLMIVLRMADYFQIDSKRVLKIPFQTKSFKSPFSYSEHVKHMQICNVQQIDDDKETLFIIHIYDYIYEYSLDNIKYKYKYKF